MLLSRLADEFYDHALAERIGLRDALCISWADEVVEGWSMGCHTQIVRLRDVFGKQRLSEGRYTPGEIDRRWEPHIEADFRGWLADHVEELPVPAGTIRDFLKQPPA